MNDDQYIHDDPDIPEGIPEGPPPRPAVKTPSPAVRFGIVICGVFVVIGVSLFIGGGDPADPTSSISINADLDGTPGGTVQSESPRYQDLLEQSNARAAERAALEGRTFIPTPERVPRPIGNPASDPPADSPRTPLRFDPLIVPAPEPAPVVARASPPPTDTDAAERPENPYTEAILEQMSALAPDRGGAFLAIRDTSAADSRAREISAAAPGADTESTTAGGEEILIPAGEIIPAETLTSTNSDLTGAPVLVELTSGEYRGSRLIGGFAVNPASEGMVVRFSTMTLPDGRTVDVTAYAVDGVTAEAAVASGVDRRYLERYGSIMASAFIGSYADARAEPEREFITLGDGTTVVREPPDGERSLYAGLGAAADAVGADLISNAPKGPKIILRDGWPLAVMFASSVVVRN